MSAGFQIYFKSGSCDLDAAALILTSHGLTVEQHPGYFTVRRTTWPFFDVGISNESWVRDEAKEIGAETPHAAVLQDCDARFEISFDSLDEVLDEMNTMIEVQTCLQEACKGILFLPWNGNLSAPEA